MHYLTILTYPASPVQASNPTGLSGLYRYLLYTNPNCRVRHRIYKTYKPKIHRLADLAPKFGKIYLLSHEVHALQLQWR